MDDKLPILVTGASGRVGVPLVRHLKAHGWSVRVVGRQPRILRALFPDLQVFGYDRIADALQGCEAVIHLAARNNDAKASYYEYKAANVDAALTLQEKAAEAGVQRFLFFSSLRALTANERDPYGLSKREAERQLARTSGIATTIVRLPAVHDGKPAGRLSFLRKLPAASLVNRLLGSVRPQLHIDTLVAAVEAELTHRPKSMPWRTIDIYDSKQDDPLYTTLRRMLDVTAALAVIVGLGWLMILLWLAIRFSSSGPGIFTQQRVGRDRAVFACHKFRTMAHGTRSVATHEVAASSVTGLGQVLRRFKLDELPQAFNLLKGDMTLVGPRPCLPQQTELIDARLERGVYRLKPGITGLAQVRGIDMSDPVKLAEVEHEYLVRQNLLLDATLLLKTFTTSALQDQVVQN